MPETPAAAPADRTSTLTPANGPHCCLATHSPDSTAADNSPTPCYPDLTYTPRKSPPPPVPPPPVPSRKSDGKSPQPPQGWSHPDRQIPSRRCSSRSTLAKS